MKLKGLYTAIVTPFTSLGELDKEGLRRNLKLQLQAGVDGVVALGSTGEDATLSPLEREKVVEIALQELKGKALVIVGTGSNSTSDALARTRKAKEMGADAALMITPYYNKPTQEGLYRHFASISDATSFPLCLYNNPGRTGVNLQTETLVRLMAFSNIIGIKEGSGNIMQISEVIGSTRQCKHEFSVLSSDDAITLPLIALGGQGIISVASNLIPGPMKSFVQSALKGDFAAAQKWHYQLLPCFDSLFIETNPIPIKAAMNLSGMASGPCRLPLCDLSETHLEKLKNVIKQFPKEWMKNG